MRRFLATVGLVVASTVWMACDGVTTPGIDTEPPDDVTPPREDVPEVTEIPRTCNGHVELCDRRVDEVTFPATHNAMSAADEGWKMPNQKYGLARQLDDGIRAMLLDVHLYKKELMLCHSLCLLGSRPLDDALFDLRDFLRANRGEVLTLILQDETDAAAIVAAFEARGLDAWAYVHEGGEWPTLRTLIDANTRLIVTAERSGGHDVPWFHHAWDLMFDNPYSYAEPEEFSCDRNRGRSSADLYLLNHWLQKPTTSPELAAVANAYDMLLGHANDCASARGQVPNFVAVDHYHVGDLFRVVDTLNGLSADELAPTESVPRW